MTKKMCCPMVVFMVIIFMNSTISHAREEHSKLIQKTYANVEELTRDCLDCHSSQGKAFIQTAHWRWKGETPFLKGNEHGVELGKINLMNDY